MPGFDGYNPLVHLVHDVLRMGYHDHRRAGGVDLVQQLHDAVRRNRIQISRGLVSDQHPGIIDNRPCNGHTLLFTGRQLLGIPLRLVFDSHQAQHLRHPALDGPPALMQNFHGKRHILEHRLLRKKTEILEYNPDPPPKLRNLTVAHFRYIELADLDLAGICFDLFQYQADERGLAGTAWSYQENEIAVIYKIGVSKELADSIVEKGSVALDGISLTVIDVTNEYFTVSLIPHTRSVTNMQGKRVGDPINVETDVIGKFVKKYLKPQESSSAERLTLDYLAEKGFM